MKNLKKALPLLLALALCVSLCAFPALAADEEFVIENGVLVKYNGPGGDVVIPDSVTSIGEGAFYDCTSLTSVVIPDGVTSIEDFAFSDCTSLTSVIIPVGVTSIGGDAFSRCESLTSVEIPDSVTSIGNGAFSNCWTLTSVTIPNSVTSIGYSAFSSCYSLTSVVIPDSVTSIGYSAFSFCSFLDNITVASGNTAYRDVDGVLFTADGKSLLCYPAGKTAASYEIPSGVTNIGEGAFSSCYSLTSVVIPAGVTSIGDYAFSSCTSLTSVVIPAGVTRIEEQAFTYCTSLTSVTIPDSVTSIMWWAFDGCDSLTDVYYGGSEAQWNAIEIDTYDFENPLRSATIHYNSAGPVPTIAGFTDVPADAYYASAVLWAATHEPVITLGYGGGVFGGGDGVKRAQAVTFLWRAAGEPEPETSANPFSDVKESEYYYKPVLWAAENGITLGNGDGTFGPDSNVTRLQMLTFMARTAGVDVSGANWVQIAEDWAAENGLSDGIPGVVDNGGDCPRSDVVYYLWKQLA